jgi:hypothetical protein
LAVLGISVAVFYDAALRAAHRSAAPFGLPVSLNVYHVSNINWVRWINAAFAPQYAPFKLGGIFHVAVEVDGKELSYGAVDSESGVSRGKPRSDPDHTYRQTIYLGLTPLRVEDIKELTVKISNDWRGDEYDELVHNCCHFADELCLLLRVGGLPRWVNRFARIGAGLRAMWSSREIRGHGGQQFFTAPGDRGTAPSSSGAAHREKSSVSGSSGSGAAAATIGRPLRTRLGAATCMSMCTSTCSDLDTDLNWPTSPC